MHPGSDSSGIVFVRKDLPGEPVVTCNVESVRMQPRWSALEHDGVVVEHTEHLLAAMAGCGLDNVCIEMDCEHIPVVSGGSCRDFTKAITKVGLKFLTSPRFVYRLKKPLYLSVPLDVPGGSQTAGAASERYLVGVPGDGLNATYLFDVPAVSGLPRGLAEYDARRDSFGDALDKARTYYLRVEMNEVKSVLSKAREDYIVLDGRSSQADVDEVARHKLVDLLGDLLLLGRPLLGRFAAFRTGHKFHHDLVRKMIHEDYLEAGVLTDHEEVA